VKNDKWYASPTYYSMLGYKPRSGASDRGEWFSRLHPDDRAGVKRKIREVLAQDFKSYEYEARMRHADGSYRWVGVAGFGVTRDADGSVSRVIGTRMDVTERKLAEEALTEEIAHRRILVEQSRDGIVVLDEHGKVDEANLKFAQMLGYSMEEMLSLHVWDWESSLPKGQVMEMLKSVDTTGDHFVTRHRRKDGSFYEVEISTNGAVFGGKKYVFCVCRDITQAKQAEREREALIKELTDALAEIKVLRGIVPLCSYCKKVRDDEGYWEQVDVYIKKHSTADVTHGICPECLKEHFPEVHFDES
jgi:PAS domain S-box-containing protein